MKLTAIIAEDEKNSQELLEVLLNNFCPEVSIIGKTETVNETIDLISKLEPDLLFLDIELRDGNGFDVIQNFSAYQFLTIFITGYDNYVIKAMRNSAFDYITKPFSIEDLKETISRAKAHIAKWKLIYQLDMSVDDFILQDDKIVLKSTKGMMVVSFHEIVYISVDEPYCKVFLKNNKLVHIQTSLKNMDEILPNYFYRIHKSFMVNLNMVKEWENGRGGNLTLINEKVLPISTRRKKEFKTRILSLNKKGPLEF